MRSGDWIIFFHALRETLIDRLSATPGRGSPGRGGQSRLDRVGDYDAWYYNNAAARAYLNHPRRSQNLVDMIERFAPESVLEFGSGLGHVLREARRRGIRIVGTETSDYAVSHSLCPDAVLKIDEIPRGRLPFADASFDLVFSSEVMEHVSESSTPAVLRELYRMASRYALFTINTWSRHDPGHINLHPRAWWLDAFRGAGFAHDDQAWQEMERMKFLSWEIFVLEKLPSRAGPATVPPRRLPEGA